MIIFFFLPWAEAYLSPLIDPSLFVKRYANMVAHLLARTSYSMSDTCIFEGIAPAFLATSLMVDFID